MRVLMALGLFSVAFAQAVFTYSDTNGELSLRAKDAEGTAITEKGVLKGYKFVLKGGARIVSKRQGITLEADRITADAVTAKGAKSPNELDAAKASGHVKFDQTAAGRKSSLVCATANYQASGATAKVTASGGVKITNVDEAAQQALTATGASGVATLDKKATQGFGLREATLTGSVRVEVREEGQSGANAVFTGDRLTMDSTKITLSGHVKGTGKGASRFGSLNNVSVLVVNLNEKREMKSFSFKSGGGQ